MEKICPKCNEKKGINVWKCKCGYNFVAMFAEEPIEEDAEMEYEDEGGGDEYVEDDVMEEGGDEIGGGDVEDMSKQELAEMLQMNNREIILAIKEMMVGGGGQQAPQSSTSAATTFGEEWIPKVSSMFAEVKAIDKMTPDRVIDRNQIVVTRQSAEIKKRYWDACEVLMGEIPIQNDIHFARIKKQMLAFGEVIEKYTPAIPDEEISDEIRKNVKLTIEDTLPKRFAHISDAREAWSLFCENKEGSGAGLFQEHVGHEDEDEYEELRDEQFTKFLGDFKRGKGDYDAFSPRLLKKKVKAEDK